MAMIEILVLLAIVVIVAYIRWKYSYWKRRQLPYRTPTFPFGNLPNPLRVTRSFHELLDDSYNFVRTRGEKHFGFYMMMKPIYVPIEPEILKAVMSKDFDYFTDRGSYYNEKDDPLTAHLFALGGSRWRQLRIKLTPTFTSGKMKTMFNTLMQCTKGMQDLIKDATVTGEALNVKLVFQRFTMDVIGSCAFGIECNSFKSDSELHKHGLALFSTSFLKNIKRVFTLSNPNLSKFIGIKVIPKLPADFFVNVLKQTINYRETNNFRRNDMLQILIDLQNDSKMALSFNDLCAQAFVFFIAGYETSSTTLNFCFYELSKNQELQNKLREEVNAVLTKHDNKMTYDAMMEMKYMQQVIDETLRKYPPATFIPRECVKDYQVPNTNTIIEKGVVTFFPVFSLQRDPAYFPEPEKFDPERFSPENRSKIVPFTYIPFGEGPRMCVGMRFGLMQIKIGLATLIRDYKFTLNEKSMGPLGWDPIAIFLETKRPILLNVHKI